MYCATWLSPTATRRSGLLRPDPVSWRKVKALTADEKTDLVQDLGVIPNGESVTVGDLAGKRRSESLRS
jgi:hypothetical protein